MRQFRHRRLAAALLLGCLMPATASAQTPRLLVPTITASAAAAADWASTYYALENFSTRETNPLLRPLAHSPSQLVTVGALMDATAVTAWSLGVGKKKPRLAMAGLWVMTAFRGYLVVHNLRNTAKATRR